MVVPLNHARPLRDTGLAMPEESATPDLVEITRKEFSANSKEHLGEALAHVARDAVWDATPIGGEIFEGSEAIGAMLTEW